MLSPTSTLDDLPAPAAAKRRGGRRRAVWLLVSLALLALAGGLLWARLGQSPGPSFQTSAVTRGPLQRTVTAVGSLQAKEYVDVGAQVSGQLKKLHVDIGDHVEEGQLIAEIDPTVYEATVRSTRAELRQLTAERKQRQAELELARIQLRRNQAMLSERAVSQNTVDGLVASVAVSEAQIEALEATIAGRQANLKGNLANLGFTKIYAPMTGTVTDKTALEGSTLNSVQSAPTIVTVSQLDVMTVWAQVAEADVNKIKVGMPAYFTTLGMPDRRFEAKVRQVQPTPETDNDVVLYNVLLDVQNDDGMLLPEMTVQVFFVLASIEDAPLVPVAALTARPDAGSDMYEARILVGGQPQTRLVQVSLANRQSAAVSSGLAVGDEVIVGTTSASPPDRGPGGPPMGPRL